MSLQVVGRLHIVGQTEQLKENFRKRDFIIEISEETASGIVYTNYAKFQLINNNCSALDVLPPGTIVKVGFMLRGKMVTKRDGSNDCFTNLTAWKVEPHNPTGFDQQQHSQPQPQVQPQTYNQRPNNDVVDDLPF